MLNHDYIGTYTGKKYHFINPSIDEVCIEDIAQALSMNCRYSGHVNAFYSVAEHSCIVADYIYHETGNKREALSALLHDASEAYLTDIPHPMKPFLIGYEEIEKRAEKVIQERFNIEPMSDLIKYVDTNIVRAEVEVLFNEVPDWALAYDHLEILVMRLTPEKAKDEFMRRFEYFGGGE